MNENPVIFNLQAKLCQTLGHTVRLKIIHLLKDGPQCVTSIAENIEVPQSTVSRHLNVLLSANILARQRKGAEVFYEIVSPKIIEVCDMMREVLIEQESHLLEIISILQE